MKALLLASALCAASTLAYAQTSGNQTGSPMGNAANGQMGTPNAPFSGGGNTDVTGSISNNGVTNGATQTHDSVNEPIRRCETFGDLSQPSRYGRACE